MGTPKKSDKKARILLAFEDPGKASPLERILRTEGFHVDILSPTELPHTLLDKPYAASIINGNWNAEAIAQLRAVSAQIEIAHIRSSGGITQWLHLQNEQTRNLTLAHRLETHLRSLGLAGERPSGLVDSPELAGFLQKQIDENPHDPRLHRLLGKHYLQHGDFKGAIPCLEQALSLCEDSPVKSENALDLGRAYLSSHQFGRARELFQHSKDPHASFLRAQTDIHAYRRGEATRQDIEAGIRVIAESLPMLEKKSRSAHIEALQVLLSAYLEAGGEAYIHSAANVLDKIDKLSVESSTGDVFQVSVGGLIVERGGTSRSMRSSLDPTIWYLPEVQVKYPGRNSIGQREVKNWGVLNENRHRLVPLTTISETPETRAKRELELPGWMHHLPNGAVVSLRLDGVRFYEALEAQRGNLSHRVLARVRLLQDLIDYNAPLEHIGTNEIRGLRDVRRFSERMTVGGTSFTMGFYEHSALQSILAFTEGDIEFKDKDLRAIVRNLRTHVQKPLESAPEEFNVWFTDPHPGNWLGKYRRETGHEAFRVGRIDFGSDTVRNGLLNAATIAIHELSRLRQAHTKYLYVRWAAQRIALAFRDRAEQPALKENITREIITKEKLSPDYFRRISDGLIQIIPANFDQAEHSSLYSAVYDVFPLIGYSKQRFLHEDIPAAELSRHLRILGYQMTRLRKLRRDLKTILDDTPNSGYALTYGYFEQDPAAVDESTASGYGRLHCEENTATRLREFIYHRLHVLRGALQRKNPALFRIFERYEVFKLRDRLERSSPD